MSRLVTVQMRRTQTVEVFSVESVYDGVARLLSVHPREADSSTGAVRIAQDPRGNDFSVRREHHFQVHLAQVRRQVGDVQVGRILLLLLKQTGHTTRWLYCVECAQYGIRLKARTSMRY